MLDEQKLAILQAALTQIRDMTMDEKARAQQNLIHEIARAALVEPLPGRALLRVS